MQQITIDLANQTMDEALLNITKNEIETVKKVLQQVYDNLNPPACAEEPQPGRERQ
jgi:hypothetical protein